MQATALRLLPSDMGGPPSWDVASQEYLDELALRRYSPYTIEWYRYVLKPFGRYLTSVVGNDDPSSVSEQNVLAFLNAVSQGDEGKPAVGARRLNHYREGLYRFYQWLMESGYASSNPVARVHKIREPKRLIQSFTEAQVMALVEQPDKTRFVGLRDYCFMLALLDTGMRLGEALSLQVPRLDLEEMAVTVIGKGNKERRIGLSARFLSELKPYLRKRQAALEALGVPEAPWVFPNDIGGKLSSKAMQQRIAAYGVQAGIRGVRVSPHTFRHTYALNFVRSGGDPFALQKILGHNSLETTRRYCELAESDVLQRQRELTPLRTMDLHLTSAKRIPRSTMANW